MNDKQIDRNFKVLALCGFVVASLLILDAIGVNSVDLNYFFLGFCIFLSFWSYDKNAYKRKKHKVTD